MLWAFYARRMYICRPLADSASSNCAHVALVLAHLHQLFLGISYTFELLMLDLQTGQEGKWLPEEEAILKLARRGILGPFQSPSFMLRQSLLLGEMIVLFNAMQ